MTTRDQVATAPPQAGRDAPIRIRRHHPEIDGLRSIAVVAVLLFHARLGLPGGFVGVDVFFVISGYLITALMLQAIDDGRFSALDFLERRIRRIFPAMGVVCAACLVAGWVIFLPRDFKLLGESVAAQSVMLSNVLFSLQTGYFAESSDFSALLHMWTLAIEAQFYLVWPFVLFGLATRARRHLAKAVLALGLVSFGLNLYLTSAYPQAAFYLLPGRTWEILLGAYLAIAPPRFVKSRWAKELLSVLGLAAVLAAILMFGPGTRFPGMAAILPCAGALLIIWTNADSLSGVGRLLARPPLVFIGVISYSLYLWHWPIFVFGRYWIEHIALSPIAPFQQWALLAASVPVAVVSWKLLETPTRTKSFLRRRSQVFALGLATTLLFFGAGLGIYLSGGVPGRFSQDVLRAEDVRKELSQLPNMSLEQARRGDFIELGETDSSKPIDVMLWGDSNASAVIPVVEARCKAYGLHGIAAVRYLTPPLLDSGGGQRDGLVDPDAAAFNAAAIAYARAQRIPKVILMGEWNRYLVGDRVRFVEAGLQESIRQLDEAGIQVWIVKQVPPQWVDVLTALGCARRFGRDTSRIGVPLASNEANTERQSLLIERVVVPGTTVLDPAPCFLNELGYCAAVADGEPLYGDKTHLSTRGAMALTPLVNRILEAGRPGRLP